ncbi:MAG: cytochrome c [Marinosulfonomonas sp.]|nr:cytochrome c [Marinosulfonomonas sp.]
MWKYRVKTIAAVGLAVLLTSEAQAISLGEFEYRNSCVQCHGVLGKGDGPVSGFMSGAVPSDLSLLQKSNGGIFPVASVYSIIEGEDQIGAHGTRDMPMWGSRYRYRVAADIDSSFSPEATDLYVRTRILSLIEYLSTLQAE